MVLGWGQQPHSSKSRGSLALVGQNTLNQRLEYHIVISLLILWVLPPIKPVPALYQGLDLRENAELRPG